MRTYVGDQEAVSASKFEELALGFEEPAPALFRELFLGRPGETPAQRAARMAAARDILAELHVLGEADPIAQEDARYAQQLSSAVPLWPPAAEAPEEDAEGKAA